MIAKLPDDLQGILWNQKIEKIDAKKNKNYIINQVLAYGAWKNLEWLFKNYSRSIIKNVFENEPEKDYTPQGYNFTKNILLSINKDLDIQKYVKTYPRDIRH